MRKIKITIRENARENGEKGNIKTKRRKKRGREREREIMLRGILGLFKSVFLVTCNCFLAGHEATISVISSVTRKEYNGICGGMFMSLCEACYLHMITWLHSLGWGLRAVKFRLSYFVFCKSCFILRDDSFNLKELRLENYRYDCPYILAKRERCHLRKSKFVFDFVHC